MMLLRSLTMMDDVFYIKQWRNIMKCIGDETNRIEMLLRIWNGIREKLSLESLEHFAQVEKKDLYVGWVREEIMRRRINEDR